MGTTVILVPLNNSSALFTFCRATTKILLVGSGKYPHGEPLACRYRKCVRIHLKVFTAPAPSVHHVWVKQGCAYCSYWMRGSTPMPYAIMAKGSPWVTPYLIFKKWPDPSSNSCTTRVAQ